MAMCLVMLAQHDLTVCIVSQYCIDAPMQMSGVVVCVGEISGWSVSIRKVTIIFTHTLINIFRHRRDLV